MVAALALDLGVLGCAAPAQCPAQSADPRNLCAHGVPNLHVVEGVQSPQRWIYRGGQPTIEGWSYLHDKLGVTKVVKLNASEESWGQGVDEPARKLGVTVVNASIPPHDYGFAPKSVVEPFREIPDDQLALAVATLAREDSGNVYVHCTHGRDRTGLIVGLYRVLVQHWEAKRAYDEMNEEGFRPLNVNLFAYWHRMFDDPDSAESKTHRERLAGLVARELAAR